MHRASVNKFRFDHDVVICKEPCRRELPCGHGCSESCGDSCCCPCEKLLPERHFGIETSQIHYSNGLLQRSLGGSSANKTYVPRQVTYQLPSHSASDHSSKAQDWNNFDAVTSDELIEKSRTSSSDSASSPRKIPIFKETHRPVLVTDAGRIPNVKATTQRVVGGLPPNPCIDASPPKDITSYSKLPLSRQIVPYQRSLTWESCAGPITTVPLRTGTATWASQPEIVFPDLLTAPYQVVPNTALQAALSSELETNHVSPSTCMPKSVRKADNEDKTSSPFFHKAEAQIRDLQSDLVGDLISFD